jgi:hypothetical protein
VQTRNKALNHLNNNNNTYYNDEKYSMLFVDGKNLGSSSFGVAIVNDECC